MVNPFISNMAYSLELRKEVVGFLTFITSDGRAAKRTDPNLNLLSPFKCSIVSKEYPHATKKCPV